MQSTRRDQVLKRLKLEPVDIPADVAEKFHEVFQSRVGSLIQYHFEAYPPTVERLADTIRTLARDAYLQGLLDGAQVEAHHHGLLDLIQKEARDDDAS